MAYGFCVGTSCRHDHSQAAPNPDAAWCEPDVLCWAKRVEEQSPRNVALAEANARLDAIWEAYWLANDAWNDVGCPGTGPDWPDVSELQAEIRALQRPLAGPIERTVEAALAARGMVPLTVWERCQIRALEAV